MSNDYNDVGKLLDHIDLGGFGYRSFRKNEDAAVAPVQAPPAAAAPAPAKPIISPASAPVEAPRQLVAVSSRIEPVAEVPVKVVAPKLHVVRQSESQSAALVAVAVPAIVVSAVVVPAAVPVAVVVPAAAPSDAPIGSTLDRLMRGSITDSAPKLHLHLELPTRPTLDGVAAPVTSGEHTLDEVFRKLHAAVAAKPRVVSGTER